MLMWLGSTRYLGRWIASISTGFALPEHLSISSWPVFELSRDSENKQNEILMICLLISMMLCEEGLFFRHRLILSLIYMNAWHMNSIYLNVQPQCFLTKMEILSVWLQVVDDYDEMLMNMIMRIMFFFLLLLLLLSVSLPSSPSSSFS